MENSNSFRNKPDSNLEKYEEGTRIKNSNSGTLNSEGGNIRLGDDYNYVINGLEVLLKDYVEQVKEIERLLHEFKPKTALSLVKSLEERIKDSEVNISSKTKSKIIFLKALCKRELREGSVKEIAKEFIKAFKVSNEEDFIETACVEYYNLEEFELSKNIADRILKLDEFNLSAWTIKVLLSDTTLDDIEIVPKSVKREKSFQHSLIYNLSQKRGGGIIHELEKKGVVFEYDLENYKELNFENRKSWFLLIELMINELLSNAELRNVTGGFYSNNDPLYLDAIKLLKTYVNTLSDTEVKGTIRHQHFFLEYFTFLGDFSKSNIDDIINIYNDLPTQWGYTISVCQILNINKRFPESLSILTEYEEEMGEVFGEFILFKAITYFLNKETDKVPDLFEEYISITEEINENNGLNIISTFLPIIRSNKSASLNESIEKVLSKKFKTDNLKVLFKHAFYIIFTEEYNKEEVVNELFELTTTEDFSVNCKNLLSECLYNLGEVQGSLDFMNTYIDKSVVSQGLRLYITILEKLLLENTEGGRGIYKELLELLEFYRLESSYVDESLLGLEHNLNLKKDDWGNLLSIDELLHKSFPNSEQYLLFYLIALRKTNNIEILKEKSFLLKDEYESEEVGIRISAILFDSKINIDKATNILYNLALNPINKRARSQYVTTSLSFSNKFLEKYSLVKIDSWVKYTINQDIHELKIDENTDQVKRDRFIGKKVNDEFTIDNPITSEIIKVKILSIYNDKLKLYYDILEEAKDPINDLGIYSMNIPTEIEELESFFVEKFGYQGSEQKSRNKKLFDDYYNYRIGFLEITRAIFNDNFLDSYIHLTSSSDCNFNTIPKKILNEIDKENVNGFAVDGSTFLLFYFLEKELQFDFKEKFIISYSLKEKIYNELITEKNSPHSSMSVYITLEGVNRHLRPEEYKERRIEFLNSLMGWIEEKCTVDLVEEKLDLTLKLDEALDDANNKTMKFLIDNIHLSIRENISFISSDTTLFKFQYAKKLTNKITSPEMFLNTFYPEKCNNDLYRYLLKSNYTGVFITKDLLNSEFFNLLSGSENYYERCLINIQFSIHNSFGQLEVLNSFLKDMYLLNSVALETKNRYAFEVLRNSMHGLNRKFYKAYKNDLAKKFNLLGDYYEEVLGVFDQVVDVYS